jgi:hypothetical protein
MHGWGIQKECPTQKISNCKTINLKINKNIFKGYPRGDQKKRFRKGRGLLAMPPIPWRWSEKKSLKGGPGIMAAFCT